MRKLIAVIVLMFLVWWIAAYVVDGMAIEPDEVYPMANKHIIWTHEKNPWPKSGR